MIPLSVLDLSPVTTGSSGPQALRNSIDLARLADRLGFTRYWVAEHHNMPNIASSAPDIMIGQIAAATEHMRVGSGGVMLPNHAPLQVAERYKVLEALFPGRIDLGLGRAPGTDPVTSYALRRRQDDPAGDDFLDRFQELLAFEQRLFPESHPFRKVNAMPADVPLPPIYLLGSSRLQRAACRPCRRRILLRASFLRFRSGRADDDLSPAVQAVGGSRTSRWRSSALHVVCADTDAEAERLATSVDLNFALRRQGQLPADPEPGGGRGAHLFADRPRADRAEPRPARRRQQGHGDGASRAADQSDAGRRGDGHDHDLRPRGAQTFLRAAGRGVRIDAPHNRGASP